MRRHAVPLTAVVAAVALMALLVYGVLSDGAGASLDDAVKRGERPAAPRGDLPALSASAGAPARAAVPDAGGGVTVLNFWASWCKPCEEEAPVLNRAQRRLERSGKGRVLGVTFRDTSSDSLRFVREHRLAFDSLRDVDGELAEAYGVNALPETFVIDRDGRIVAIARGQVDDAFVDRALDEAGA